MSAPKTWDKGDPIEAAIWDVCDHLQAGGWNLSDAGDGKMPAPDEMFPSELRRAFRALHGDQWREARIAALRSELETLEASR